jgi:hypothetical protein
MYNVLLAGNKGKKGKMMNSVVHDNKKTTTITNTSYRLAMQPK